MALAMRPSRSPHQEAPFPVHLEWRETELSRARVWSVGGSQNSLSLQCAHWSSGTSNASAVPPWCGHL